MPKITIEDLGRTLMAPPGANLREALLASDVTVYPFLHAVFPLNCGGRGLCGTCRVKVTAGEDNLSPRTGAEARKLRKRPDLRLACQISVKGDVSLQTLPS